MIEWYKYDDKWPEVKEAARNTIGRSGPGKYPDYWWKKRLLLAEHSPIRRIKASWRWVDLKYWVSVHFNAEVNGKQYKPFKSKEQLLKWYNGLHKDPTEYKMWGNGIALPCADFVLGGIAEILTKQESEVAE